MLEFSLDQHGSRFIQQKLDNLTPDELSAAFSEISPKAVMLMNDVFGNYVIQKVLELGPDSHRHELAQQIKGQVRPRPAPPPDDLIHVYLLGCKPCLGSAGTVAVVHAVLTLMYCYCMPAGPQPVSSDVQLSCGPESPGGVAFGSADIHHQGVGWSCHEMCERPEWQPCHTKVH